MAIDEVSTVLEPRPLPNFVETPAVKDLTERALGYIRAGFPIHLRGATGTGKTTLALHVAAQIGRPVVMIHGDEEFSTSDMVGGQSGYRRKKAIDNFIHSVLKTDESLQQQWVANRLTVACKYGFTLIYDEFTSNPSEYAGVHKAQDALKDRMINIRLGHYDRETEIAITMARSGVAKEDAEKVVDLVRAYRAECDGNGRAPSVRASIMVAKVLQAYGARASAADVNFVRTCVDVLGSPDSNGDGRVEQKVAELAARLAG